MASLSGWSNCLRIITIIFNFIVVLCGLAIVGFSSYLLYTINATFTDGRPQEYGVVAAFLAVGLLVFLLGFLGCCGAWKENVCMLITFAVVVGLLLICQIVLVILGFIYKDKLPEIIHQFLEEQLALAMQGSPAVMDNIQTSLKCCGVSGPADYGGRVPPSCENYLQGCQSKFEDLLVKFSTALFVFSIFVAILQLAAIVVAGCLLSSIRSSQTV